MSRQQTSDGGRMRSEDSWIEISSQPLSSSPSSQGHNEILTTGLDVRAGARQLRLHNIQVAPPVRSTSVAGSSQDEYEESESDSDRVLSSSNEEINQNSGDEDGDETTTALGIGSRTVFTPQPNAFSHPPQPRNARSASVPDSYFPSVPQASHCGQLPPSRLTIHTPTAQRTWRRERSSSLRPQQDHDAALRASLTTLLSCAAAVRGPKNTKIDETPPSCRVASQPTALRLVPESELNLAPRLQKPASKRRSRESSKERQAKKIRALKVNSSQDDVLSPTVVTWMISAGMVLVFSAISFSAGYAWGKEVGRVEGAPSCQSGMCGSETVRDSGGLRKLRWGAGSQSIRV